MMTYPISKLIKPIICMAFISFGMSAMAQVSLIQRAIDKLEGYKNFSYQDTYKQKEYTNDTLIMYHKDVFSRAPEDKISGYLFSMETLIMGEKFPYMDVYNGQNLMHITPGDSSYSMSKIRASATQQSLLGYLKRLNDLLHKRPYRIAGDTTINAIAYAHLIMNTYDTIINKEHYYTRIHLIFDKLSGMPIYIIGKSRHVTGDGVTNYYSKHSYFNYKFDQDNIDLASIMPPKGLHPSKKLPVLTLLSPGTVAPDWTLYTADGKKMSLSQMKGKIVLLDFYFIGCTGCMLSIKPMNNLHKKYKNQNVVIASITERDSKKSVLAFDKQYRIYYPGYVEAADVVKSYHVTGFPTFYFIDKEGKVANVFNGYDDDFEQKAALTIDGLLKK